MLPRRWPLPPPSSSAEKRSSPSVAIMGFRCTLGHADERYYSDGGLFLTVLADRAVVAQRVACERTRVRRRQVAAGGFSSKRLARVRELLERHVDSGFVPGVVAVLARHGEVHIEATGNLAFEGAGSRTP